MSVFTDAIGRETLNAAIVAAIQQAAATWGVQALRWRAFQSLAIFIH